MQKREGSWIIVIVECADGTYYSNMCQDIRKQLWEIQNRQGVYFSKHPERLPVTVVFKEENLPFKEAYAKLKYLRGMNRSIKERMVKTQKWPAGKAIYEFFREEQNNEQKT